MARMVSGKNRPEHPACEPDSGGLAERASSSASGAARREVGMSGERRLRIGLFTDRYPYGRGETFVENELRSPAAGSVEIILVPARKAAQCRELPPGISLSDILTAAPLGRRMIAACRTLFSPHLWRLPFAARRPENIRQARNALGGLYRAYLTFLSVKAHRAAFSGIDVLYGYWLDNTATGLAMVKHVLREFRDIPLVCRAHGYDMFEEQRGVFFPARAFALKYVDRLYPVSRAGETYLRGRYPEQAGKIFCRYLGVENVEELSLRCRSQVPGRRLVRFVSCANVIALKRIDLTMERVKQYAAAHPDTEVSWTHFGDGPLLKELAEKATSGRPDNLRIVFAGAQPNREILRRYAAGEFDIFLSLSLSEGGGPVAAFEAMSCGIVPVCTDSGGPRDTVDATLGALLSLEVSYEEFESAIERILRNYPAFSVAAREKQRREFCSRDNYAAFYREIASLRAEDPCPKR